MTDITIGQYFPGDSCLHRLDPRFKIVLLFLFFFALFWVSAPQSYAFLSLCTLAFIALSKLPPSLVFRSLKPLMWIIVFTFVIHLFSTPGEEFARVWRFSATWEGLSRGFLFSLRLALLFVLSALLTFTTGPLKLTYAMESILSPGKRFGLPAGELAMMMTIALRFVPTLIEETHRLIKAQKSRGVDFSGGNFIERIQAAVPIMVPLFLSAFRRADDLAMAMEARCYCAGAARTHLNEPRITSLDYKSLIVGLILILLAVLLDCGEMVNL